MKPTASLLARVTKIRIKVAKSELATAQPDKENGRNYEYYTQTLVL